MSYGGEATNESSFTQTIRGTTLVTSDRQGHSVGQDHGACFRSPLQGVAPERTLAASFLLRDGLNRIGVCTTVAPGSPA